MSDYISNLDAAIVKLRSKRKRDASKKLLPQEKEALVVLLGLISVPIIVAGLTILIN